MGYAGYVPAKLPPGKPSAVQAALWQIESLESLAIVGKLLKNAAVEPKEEKFRRIKLQNSKIQSLIVQQPGALQALLLLGWEYDSQDKDQLVISSGRYFSMSEVRLIQDAEERLKKAQREAQRSTASRAA